MTTIALLLILSIAIPILPINSQVPKSSGQTQTIYAFMNAGPNPIGVGQVLTLNFFMASPLLTSQIATNWTVLETQPDGSQVLLGPFVSDTTGGSYTTITPETTGNYTFQAFFGQQTLSNGVIALAAESNVVTVTVQEEPVQQGYYAITPLPTEYWQTPVTAENVQEWYKITGPWLGLGSVTFATTGGYNLTGNYNPYTASVMSGHILWTKIWASGGVAGGEAGGTESSNYWSTSQYQPKYAPVIINGIMYSQWFPTTMGTNQGQGIQAVDIYTGQTLWIINTTNPLRCGMNTQYHQINQYGVIGPFIWTTGTLPASDTGGTIPNNNDPIGDTLGIMGTPTTSVQWNMYQGLTGQYMLSIVNGTSASLTTDESGNLIGYYVNATAGTEPTYPVPGRTVMTTSTGPHLTCWNMTMAIGQTGGSWQPARNTVREWQTGVMWTAPLPNVTSTGGQTINTGASGNPIMAINGITNDAVVMTAGYTFGQGFGGQMNGWLLIGAMDAKTGAQLWAHNVTSTETDTLAPDSRVNVYIQDGKVILANMAYSDAYALDARTGTHAWSQELRDANGDLPHGYTVFGLRSLNGPDGKMALIGFGGDIWCLDTANGNVVWQTTTNDILGNPGLETPYAVWPLWVFSCQCADNNFAYIPIGHEYNPPLFHGAQLLALNWTDGSLGWKILDTSVTSTSIAYGIILSLNAYDNMIYAFGKGPTSMTVSAPSVGVTTATPIVVTGTITDVSPGTRAIVQPDETMTKQNEVALRFPNGLPCVSDESQSLWMEYVYQQQPLPTNTTGVPVTLSVVDSNGNYRQIGETTSVDGTFSFTWTPDISGDYQIIASFAGSNSYWPSSAIGHFTAGEAAATTGPSATPPPGVATTTDLMTYMAIGVIIILIAIAIVGVLVLRRH
ncbi:MAG: PQQ-binding-like beta-propeller repeat protein [Candidatus Bathyarchaeia archaeon]